MCDPKDNFHACSDFLNIVLDAHIAVATAEVLGCHRVDDIKLRHLTPSGEVPRSTAEQLRLIEGIAKKVVDKFIMYRDEECQLVSRDGIEDGIYNYACMLLSMGLLARNFQDASHEGDGERTIRCWRFLLLHYKEAGHTKYALEALNLVAEVDTILTPKEAHQLKWNRSCSIRGGQGTNVPLDLHMEHLNRTFKEKIAHFSSSINESNVKRVSKVAREVDHILTTFDKTFSLKPQTSISQRPSHAQDLKRIVAELEDIRALLQVPKRSHTAFPRIPHHPFTLLVSNLDKFQDWVKSKRDEFARRQVFREFCRKRKQSVAVLSEHSYAHLTRQI